jgi:hypothetical protein
MQAKKLIALSIAPLVFASVANAAQPKICIFIRNILIQRQQGHEPKDFYIAIQEREGSDSYQGLDIDGDKINDSVVRSCGASPISTCFLSVKLSTGKQLELEEDHFFLGRIKNSVYIIVGETSENEKYKRNKRKIYQLNKKSIQPICQHI